MFIIQAFSLRDQIGHISGVFGVVFVPASVQEFPVPLHGYSRNQDDSMVALDQILSQGFVVIGCGLQAEDRLGEAILNLQGLGLEEELLESSRLLSKTSLRRSVSPVGVPKKA
jgi:hypothetical protein